MAIDSSTNFLEKKYDLKKNPFKEIIGTSSSLKVWVNREAQLKQWRKIISDSITSDRNYISLIIGTYGEGKTFSLLKIMSEVNENYSSNVFPTFLNFKGEEKSKPGLDFLSRIFKSIQYNEIAKNEKNIKRALDKLPLSLSEPKNVFNKLFLGDEDERKLALYFLTGQLAVNKTQLAQLGVLRKIDKIDVAKEYLAAFLCLVKSLGFSSLLLAVDEFEYLFSLVTRSQQGIYFALLRSLFDFKVEYSDSFEMANMVIFIAISSSGYDKLMELENREISTGGPIVPLKRRFSAQVTLGSFSKKDTEKLIESRLKFDRKRNVYARKPLIPFTADFVDFIWKNTEGILEKIISRCDQVLDIAIADRVTKIDQNFAKKVLATRGF